MVLSNNATVYWCNFMSASQASNANAVLVWSKYIESSPNTRGTMLSIFTHLWIVITYINIYLHVLQWHPPFNCTIQYIYLCVCIILHIMLEYRIWNVLDLITVIGTEHVCYVENISLNDLQSTGMWTATVHILHLLYDVLWLWCITGE